MANGSDGIAGKAAGALGLLAAACAVAAFVSWRDGDPGAWRYLSVLAGLVGIPVAVVARIRARRAGAPTTWAVLGGGLSLLVTAMWLLGFVMLLRGLR